jgi:hypothetical protein
MEDALDGIFDKDVPPSVTAVAASVTQSFTTSPLQAVIHCPLPALSSCWLLCWPSFFPLVSLSPSSILPWLCSRPAQQVCVYLFLHFFQRIHHCKEVYSEKNRHTPASYQRQSVILPDCIDSRGEVLNVIHCRGVGGVCGGTQPSDNRKDDNESGGRGGTRYHLGYDLRFRLPHFVLEPQQNFK